MGGGKGVERQKCEESFPKREGTKESNASLKGGSGLHSFCLFLLVLFFYFSFCWFCFLLFVDFAFYFFLLFVGFAFLLFVGFAFYFSGSQSMLTYTYHVIPYCWVLSHAGSNGKARAGRHRVQAI